MAVYPNDDVGRLTTLPRQSHGQLTFQYSPRARQQGPPVVDAELQHPEEAGPKAPPVIWVAVINTGQAEFFGGDFIELVVGPQFNDVVAVGSNVFADLNVHTVFVAGEHQ